MGAMYRSGFFLRKEDGVIVADLIFKFLALYAKCASIALGQRKRRFAMVPKVHMVCHAAQQLHAQSQLSNWVENPVATTNQQQEDFIGKPSRISRRVSIRSMHKSLFMRSLIVYQQSLEAVDRDMRGMDAYPDV